MGIKPLLDRVVVEPVKAEEKSAGGIIMQSTSEKTVTNKGKVVAVGPGVKNSSGELITLGVTVGDTVLYSTYGGTEVKVNGMDYLVLSETNILGILE